MQFKVLALATCASLVAAVPAVSLAQWQPTKAIEIVVPFSAGGASDQMARVIQAIITKHNLIAQPLVILNKAGASGAEGIMDVKASARDAHKLLIGSTAFDIEKDQMPVVQVYLNERLSSLSWADSIFTKSNGKGHVVSTIVVAGHTDSEKSSTLQAANTGPTEYPLIVTDEN